MDFSLFFSFILITLLSMDALIFGLSYGMEHVYISPLCLFLISFISGGVLTISFFCGDVLSNYIPPAVAKWLPFLVLLLLAFYKLYDALPFFHWQKNEMTTETLSHKINQQETQVLSPQEASLLAVTLSVDNISAGLSIGSLHIPILFIFIYSVVIHFITIYAGWTAGQFFSSRCSHNLSLAGAILLLVLAFLQLR